MSKPITPEKVLGSRKSQPDSKETSSSRLANEIGASSSRFNDSASFELRSKPTKSAFSIAVLLSEGNIEPSEKEFTGKRLLFIYFQLIKIIWIFLLPLPLAEVTKIFIPPRGNELFSDCLKFTCA